MSGQLTLRLGRTERTVDAGDTVFFEAHAPHRYAAVGDEPARFLMVVVLLGDSGMVPPTGIAQAEPSAE